MKLYKIFARFSHAWLHVSKETHKLSSMLSTPAFWLGALGKKGLDYSDEVHYSTNTTYVENEYNEKGLYDWEQYIVEKHFADVKTIMLIAAGGGREVVGLSRMGFRVDAFECNPVLVEYGNKLLKKNNIESKISHLARNTVPSHTRIYDAVIIGWGAYSHIKGGPARIQFLKNLHPFMHPGSRLMISFIWVKERNRRDKMIQRVSGFLGSFCRGERSEQGDSLFLIISIISRSTRQSELTKAGSGLSNMMKSCKKSR
jgi:hypothetical protein